MSNGVALITSNIYTKKVNNMDHKQVLRILQGKPNYVPGYPFAGQFTVMEPSPDLPSRELFFADESGSVKLLASFASCKYKGSRILFDRVEFEWREVTPPSQALRFLHSFEPLKDGVLDFLIMAPSVRLYRLDTTRAVKHISPIGKVDKLFIKLDSSWDSTDAFIITRVMA